MKQFLVLQVRPEDAASDNEFDAFLIKGKLLTTDVVRIRLDQEPLPAHIDARDFSGIIVGGGPACVSTPHQEKSEVQKRFDHNLMKLCDTVVKEDIPFLGACYGIGILASHEGARVSKERYGEAVGATELERTDAGKDDPITASLPETFKAFCGHKEAVQEVPKSATLLLTSKTCPVQMIRVGKNVYATQFHPELDTVGLILRINVYKHAGYFPAHEADTLIERCRAEDVQVPEQILINFIDRYRSK